MYVSAVADEYFPMYRNDSCTEVFTFFFGKNIRTERISVHSIISRGAVKK